MRFARWILGAVFAAAGMSANAGVVSGAHYTDGGKLVHLQGLEWQTLDSARGYSRAAIEGGALGYFSDGWRYATRAEAGGLLMSLWGGTYSGGSIDNGDGADWFFRNLGHGNLQAGSAMLRSFFYGSAGECSGDASLSCRGFYGVSYSNAGHPPTGWFYSEYGLDALHPVPATVEANLMDNNYGHLLVRALPVPEPSSMVLFGAGLAGLGLVHRRRRPRA